MTIMGGPRGEPRDYSPPPSDIKLSDEDRETLLRAVAAMGATDNAAHSVLRPLNINPGQLPAWAGTRPEDWWGQVFADFDNGIVVQPYLRLIASLTRRYQANATLLRLTARYLTPEPEVRDDVTRSTCHVIVRASSEEERAAAIASLRDVGLGPREQWATQHAVSYAVESTEPPTVREALSRTELGWTVVPPGQPDYLLRDLYVQGPDGTRYRLVDAPVQQTFRNVAVEVVEQYGPEFADASRPTVIDHVRGDGHRERVNPDDTLHQAGVRDGDQLRVGFEAAAGAVAR